MYFNFDVDVYLLGDFNIRHKKQENRHNIS